MQVGTVVGIVVGKWVSYNGVCDWACSAIGPAVGHVDGLSCVHMGTHQAIHCTKDPPSQHSRFRRMVAKRKDVKTPLIKPSVAPWMGVRVRMLELGLGLGLCCGLTSKVEVNKGASPSSPRVKAERTAFLRRARAIEGRVA